VDRSAPSVVLDESYPRNDPPGGALPINVWTTDNSKREPEFQAVNYEIFTSPGDSSREWVPFLLLGGGYIKTLSPRTSVYAEVLFDVLQDEGLSVR
jgi:hypothetical protein